jgi:hypothetical protein
VDRIRRFPRVTLATVVVAVAVLATAGAGTSGAGRVPTASSTAVPPPVAGRAAADGPSTPARPMAAAGGAPRVAPMGSGGRREAGRALEAGAPTSDSPEGFAVLAGSSEAGTGPTVRFTVEVEPATGIDPAEALEVAEEALYDARSWSRDTHLVRVADPAQADIRLLFATPTVVDRLCDEAGLDTFGVYSCWNGRFAAINSWRYAFGATGFDEQASYRRYVVNHEVGHGLGHRHVRCPQPGAIAPVMLQQSASLEGCVANGWPHPEG